MFGTDNITILTILKIGSIILSIILFFNYDKNLSRVLYLSTIVCSILLFLENKYTLFIVSFILLMLAYILWVVIITIKSRFFNIMCIQLLLLASSIIFLKYTMAMP